jgi:hypothetical protein
MPKKARDVEHKLTDKFGFLESRRHSSDHKWYELQLDGLPLIATKISHSSRDIPPKIEGMIARQLRVHGPFFDGMIACKNNREAYYRKVRTDPYPPWEIHF